LRFVLDDVTTLPLDEALPVVRAIGEALQFLHAKSIVHGQLTAENVFITEELDVRLLDVVPLDSASTILRGVASRDPFSRCDISDDIYSLACLTYEVLAGKHPFNFHPPAEASLSGLKPARIRSLPEKQWNAMRRALSFDRDERPATVREFLTDLGVTGTERLRPSGTGPADRNDAPPASRPAPSIPEDNDPATAQVAPAVVSGPTVRDEKRRKLARARRNRASRIRSLFLAVILGGLVAWYFYGQPRDDIAGLPALVDAYLDPAPIDNGATEPPVAAQEITSGPAEAAVAETNTDIPVEPVVEPAPAPANQLPTQPEPRPLAEPANDTEAVATETAVEPETLTEVPGSTLIQSFVTVYERDGAARIAFRQPVSTAGALFWWTGDDTAVADADYIALEQPVIAFASGEEAETLHIPLVNDSLPEPRETFYVFLGQRSIESGRLEPIARIRIDVNDDD
jgi:hypothetical protein